MEEIADQIKSVLEKNGFPEKRVRLPFQPVFKSCKNRGRSLSAVLNHLKSSDILHVMESERILFFHKNHPPSEKSPQNHSAEAESQGIPDAIYAEAMNQIKNMDPEAVERIREQVKNMSPDERAELMKQAQQLFSQKNRQE